MNEPFSLPSYSLCTKLLILLLLLLVARTGKETTKERANLTRQKRSDAIAYKKVV